MSKAVGAVVVGLLTAAVVAGCGSGSGTEAVENPIPTVTVTETPSVAASPEDTVEPPPSGSPSAKAPDQYVLGDTVRVEDDLYGESLTYKTSVLKYQATVEPSGEMAEWIEPDVKGNRFSAVLLQWCLDENTSPDGVSVSTNPWSLRYASGAVVDTTGMVQASDVGLSPEYPEGAVVPLSTCAKGWAIFETPGNEDPTLVVYSPETGETVTWEMK